MTNPPRLQPVAFTLRPETWETPRIFWSLPFPASWKPGILQLQAEATGRQDQSNTMPTITLDGVIAALLPYLSTIPQRVTKDAGWGGDLAPWILAHAAIPLEKIEWIMRAWLARTYQDCPSLPTILETLTADALEWQQLPVVGRGAHHPNNTAKPAGVAYHLIPDLLADALAERAQIPVGGEPKALVRVPVEEGAQLMSWPPAYHTNRAGRGGWFSYTLTISMRTLVGNPEPRIHIHYGVRRWVSQPLLVNGKLRLGQMARSVYLHKDGGWLGLAPTHAFTVAHLRGQTTEAGRQAVWNDRVPDIAQALRVPFPAAETLVTDPTEWFVGKQGIQAGIVEHWARYHPIQAGMGLEDHEALTTIVQHALAGELILDAPLTRLPIFHKPAAHPLMQDLQTLPAATRLAAVETAIGPEVHIEVRWQTEAGRDMLMDRIQALLLGEKPEKGPAAPADPEAPKAGRNQEPAVVPLPAPDTVTIPLPGGGSLRIIPSPLGEIGGLLPAPARPFANGQERGAYRRKATEERALGIKKYMDDTHVPTLTFIELPNYQSRENRYEAGHRDPKRALRLGLARTGRVTKFVTGASDRLQNRCESAVRDGLRQVGYLPAPIGFSARKGAQLPDDLIVAGVWMVRLTQKRGFSKVHLPVVVLLHTRHTAVRAWIPDGKGVRSYHQALLDITTLAPDAVSSKKQGVALRELERFLTHDLLQEGTQDVVILVDAQNARQTWPGLQDGQIELGALRFAKDGPPVTLDQMPGRVRVIRLRTSDRYETPEWYVPGAELGHGVIQGIWPLPGTVTTYYNNGSKPHTQKQKRRGKQIDPGEHYALPSLLEILPIALQPQESPAIWATAVDQWRRMGRLLTSSMLLLPLPLAWARHMDRYAAVIGPWVLNEWEQETPDLEDEEEDELALPRQLTFDF